MWVSFTFSKNFIFSMLSMFLIVQIYKQIALFHYSKIYPTGNYFLFKNGDRLTTEVSSRDLVMMNLGSSIPASISQLELESICFFYLYLPCDLLFFFSLVLHSTIHHRIQLLLVIYQGGKTHLLWLRWGYIYLYIHIMRGL